MLLLPPLPPMLRKLACGSLDTIHMCLVLLLARALGMTAPWVFEVQSCSDAAGMLVGIPVLASMHRGILLTEPVLGTVMPKLLLLVTGSEQNLCLPS